MTTTSSASPQPCALPEARQFDFWIGDWEASWGDGRHGYNHVEAVLEGCVILEQFDGQPGTPLRGMSVSVYSPALGAWRQTWVDSQGNYWAFSGGFAGGRMILATDELQDGRPVRLRMVWYNLAPDAFDWNWERSDDDGQTWQVMWQLRYMRRGRLPG